VAIRSRDVYRGRKKRHYLITIPLFIIALLLIIAVSLFYYLQRYVVVTQDGVSLELPFLSDGSAGQDSSPGQEHHAYVNTVVAELIYEEPDYSSVRRAGAGEDLIPMKALYVPYNSINDQGLDYYVGLMSAYGADALVLQMKPPSGRLSWASSNEDAAAYDVNGSYDIGPAVEELKAMNLYLTAELSCFYDELMAARNPALALHTASGDVYSDAVGKWLDPYSEDVRRYIVSLARELADMVFDEILLTDMSYPSTGQELAFSQEMSTAPSPVTTVSNFAVSVSDDIRRRSRVSGLISARSLEEDGPAATGQDPAVLIQVFDRLYCPTDNGALEQNRAAVAALLGPDGEGLDTRFVPVSAFVPESSCWVFRQ